MRLVKTEDAVGQVLCHDITQIIPGEKKGPVFKKGHIVKEEDIPVLLSVGKEHLYVWELRDENSALLHENEAAGILKDICMGDSDKMEATGPSEGKIEILASSDGLLKVDSEKLKRINSLGGMMIATVHGNFPVRAGDKLAGTRIIPLVIEKEKMDRAVKEAEGGPVLSLLPFRNIKAGIVTTGNEVALGRIKDGFGPVLERKLKEYDVKILGQKILKDDMVAIRDAVLDFAGTGAELILVTGGMSVDPDDQTPGAIKDTGAQIVSYGAPVLPGAMFLLAYLSCGDRIVPVMGLPGCIMYAKRTVFDLVLPRILAGERLSAEDLSSYGEGGLCLSCEECRFPNCGFGK
ncbi:MAG: molybdopterin-binding protein [Lachnospiraceae bacterium]|nr:molybdopterin-binding protein [Lachnospiraceae bacterium]